MSFWNNSTTTTTTDTTTTRAPLPSVSTRKLSLSVGINDYPGTQNDLRGCVNDANEWATGILKPIYGFKSQVIVDKQATANAFLGRFGNLVSESKTGDHIVITYSGHGTNVPDRNGDETDGRDEALCLYDRIVTDDEIRAIASQLHPEARLTFISDSCHSGTVTRAFLQTMVMDKAPMPRYLPPEDVNEAYRSSPANVKGRMMYPEQGMNEVLISGCLPTEYSYDARLGGRYMGAMSYHTTNILKATPSLTYNDFFVELRKQLPSGRYPQTPQLEGSAENKSERMFI